MNARTTGILQALRNSHGPSWLFSYSIAKQLRSPADVARMITVTANNGDIYEATNEGINEPWTIEIGSGSRKDGLRSPVDGFAVTGSDTPLTTAFEHEMIAATVVLSGSQKNMGRAAGKRIGFSKARIGVARKLAKIMHSI